MAIGFDVSGTSNLVTTAGTASATVTIDATARIILAVFHSVNGAVPDTVAIGSQQLTLVASDSGQGTLVTQVWALADPPSGSQTITATGTSMTGTLNVSSYTESESVWVDNVASGHGLGNGLSLTKTLTPTMAGEWGLNCITTIDESVTLGAGETVRQNVTNAGVGSQAIEDRGPLTKLVGNTMKWNGVANTIAYSIVAISFGIGPGVASQPNATNKLRLSIGIGI